MARKLHARPNRGPSNHPVPSTFSHNKVKRKFDSRPEKIERTGGATFNVHHDDGSIFECRCQNAEMMKRIGKAGSPPSRRIVMRGVGAGNFVAGNGWNKKGKKLKKIFKLK